jgi:hypothetical protein
VRQSNADGKVDGSCTEFRENATLETGEESERTRCSIKGKLFHMEGGDWKERGVGTLKLNCSINDASISRLGNTF